MKYIPETKRELLELVMKKDVFLGDIHTSKITDMSFLFSFYDDVTNEKNDRKDFSGIESWDVSNVVNMEGSLLNVMFLISHLESGILVQNFEQMFENCDSFNQPLEDWNLFSAKNMNYMFFDCQRFKQSIEKWDLTKIENCEEMFTGSAMDMA